MAEILIFLDDREAWSAPRDELARSFLAAVAPDGPAPTPAPVSGASDLRDVGWTYPGAVGEVEVWLARGGWGVSVDGSTREALRVALWFRGLVPDDVAVRLTDDGYSFDRELAPGEVLDDLERWYEDEVGELF
ncbi:hypothetical protein [Luteimicrobium subarcticum]|uniref:Uncharacterized protein n=1 Tax=Luteimicrobium subarcticum TaxID=620910 RepID=A0A2M8W7B5_9MICO|nr:hypothetical protein [Luteimicrobium subarcticum]PJI86784.1 hypothetical protein CLV34_2707 [Luteimicrobium subarcticum]